MHPATNLLKEKHHGVLITGVQLCTEICKVSVEALEHFRKVTWPCPSQYVACILETNILSYWIICNFLPCIVWKNSLDFPPPFPFPCVGHLTTWLMTISATYVLLEVSCCNKVHVKMHKNSISYNRAQIIRVSSLYYPVYQPKVIQKCQG